MEFGEMFAKIGTVKQVLEGGAIKARVEGTFDDEDLTKLPPIKYSPFAGDNGFSVPSMNRLRTASLASLPIAIAIRSHFEERPSLMKLSIEPSQSSFGAPSEQRITNGR